MNRRASGALTVAAVAAAPRVLGHPAVRRRELALLRWVVERRPVSWRGPTVRVTELAAPVPVTAGVATAALWSYGRGAAGRDLVRPVAVAASGVLVRRLAAEVIRRDRPPAAWWWATPNGYSYPSRHVGWAAFGAAAASDLLAAARDEPRGGEAAAATVATIAATRVVLAVHWPTDVAAAWCFAGGWRRLLAR